MNKNCGSELLKRTVVHLGGQEWESIVEAFKLLRQWRDDVRGEEEMLSNQPLLETRTESMYTVEYDVTSDI